MADAGEARRFASYLGESLDGFREGFFSLDKNWRFIACNKVCEQHMGFSAEAVLGRDFWTVFPRIADLPLGDLMREVMSSRRPALREAYSALYPEILLALRCNLLGEGIAVAFRDITRTRKAENRLRESEARFRATADSAPAAIWITDVPGDIEFVNQAFFEYAGRPREGLLGKAWLTLLHPDDAPTVLARREAARVNNDAYEFEARFRFGTGEWRWMRASAKPRIDPDGVFQGYVGLAIDVTETRAAENRQQLLINELNHRVKNTLATIQSIARQTFRDAVVSREARNLFTDRLMALSAAHNVLTRENWDAPELTGVATEAVQAYDDPRAPRIRLNGPPVRIRPNAALAISLALHELATNATKYGALRAKDGYVDLEWTLSGDGAQVEVRWCEVGGPPVAAPPSHGFGSRLLGSGLAGELGQPAIMDWRADGLVCRIVAPVFA
ncbi:HWE histidine kinase domain-containing protein [Phenylobacterium immobile]|uniref:HWE histidine kinase domain-containing protein n=1 Tax=Phenylobacterium immobile TaxID=21 RepID=UPI000AF4184E|nr:HWE histidine kinase domain-containing protein [Phenylobacterium immobile]